MMTIIKYSFLMTILFALNTSALAADSNTSNTEKLGDALYILIPASAYASTFYKNDKQGRIQFYKSILTNTVITLGLKKMVKKERPNGKDMRSFPSGHTSTTFQSAAFIHRRYGLKAAIPLYLGASYVAYSRVESNNHYTEDVVAGALIGSLSSYYFTHPYKTKNHNTQLMPVVSKKMIGLKLTAHW